MKCSACGLELPAGVAYCPNCGTPTPAYYATSGTSANNPTVSSSETVPPSPYTNYGSQQYGAQSPYGTPPSNPYETPAPPSYFSSGEAQYVPPPPPPEKPRGNRTGLIIGIVVLVLVIIVGGVLAITRLGGTSGGSTSATPTVAPAQATESAQAHATATASAAASATAQAQASATATVIAANPNPYTPGQGKLALIDPLNDNSRGYAWDVSNQADGICAFSGGSYHSSTQKTNFFFICTAQATDFSNFAVEVQMRVLQGDCGGMVFRADSNTGKMYFLEVCQDGTYRLYRYLDFTGNNVKNLAGGTSAAITTGLNQTNTIAVVAQGSTLSVYVNKQKIATASDSTFTHGQISLVADSYNHPTEVAYNNIKVWTY